jgi:hypothetical protein
MCPSMYPLFIEFFIVKAHDGLYEVPVLAFWRNAQATVGWDRRDIVMNES